MESLGIHHVSINVTDAAEAIDFYVGHLGFVQRDDRPDFGIGGAWLDVGAQQVHLIETDVPADKGQHFAVQVAHLDATVAELRSGGLDVGDPSPIGTGRQAFLRDPSGNLVELHQPA